MGKRKRMNSWERRRRRRIIVTIIVTVLLTITAAVCVVCYSLLPIDTMNLKRFVVVEYSGYDTKGTALVTIDNEELNDFLEKVKEENDSALVKFYSPGEEDFDAFKESIIINCDAKEDLKNGDSFTISFDYDKELAKKLNIRMNDSSMAVTVAALDTPTVITKDELFKDIEVTFSGMSPNITAEIVNNSPNEFIRNMVFSPEEYTEFYKTGDVMRLRAYFSEEEALKNHYVIDASKEDCVKEFAVEGLDTYLTNPDKVAGSILEEAIAAGKQAFNNANEYGVRIFCEAHLVPVYINKKATFEWLTPSLLSAYFKVAHDGVAGVNGNHYNDLDLVYKCKITQADGVTCDAEAVVRFSNFIERSDGHIEYDFSNPKLISASYNNSSIVKTVKTMYEDTYEIYKLK